VVGLEAAAPAILQAWARVQDARLIIIEGHNPPTPPDYPKPNNRVRAMLASRACRSSIMIGRALDAPSMRKILTRLADLEAPWNCPHGRPTMRHLAVLPECGVSLEGVTGDGEGRGVEGGCEEEEEEEEENGSD